MTFGLFLTNTSDGLKDYDVYITEKSLKALLYSISGDPCAQFRVFINNNPLSSPDNAIYVYPVTDKKDDLGKKVVWIGGGIVAVFTDDISESVFNKMIEDTQELEDTTFVVIETEIFSMYCCDTAGEAHNGYAWASKMFENVLSYNSASTSPVTPKERSGFLLRPSSLPSASPTVSPTD